MSEDDGNSEPFEPVESKDETFGAETPVTGQTKMQAAWSASDEDSNTCLLYTSPSPRDKRQSRMPSSA